MLQSPGLSRSGSLHGPYANRCFHKSRELGNIKGGFLEAGGLLQALPALCKNAAGANDDDGRGRWCVAVYAAFEKLWKISRRENGVFPAEFCGSMCVRGPVVFDVTMSQETFAEGLKPPSAPNATPANQPSMRSDIQCRQSFPNPTINGLRTADNNNTIRTGRSSSKT